MIHHGCPHCGNWRELADSVAGTTVLCPYCRRRAEVTAKTNFPIAEALRVGTGSQFAAKPGNAGLQSEYTLREYGSSSPGPHLQTSIPRDLHLRRDDPQELSSLSLLWRGVGLAFVVAISVTADMPLAWWITGQGAALIVCSGVLGAMLYYLAVGLWDL